MDKIKVLICQQHMYMGGLETALLNLLKKLTPDRYDVDLLLLDNSGDLFNEIPEYVNVIFDKNVEKFKMNATQAIFYQLRRFRIISAVKILLSRLRCYNNPHVYDFWIRKIPKRKYDAAINYNNWANYFTLYIKERVEAREKLLYVHFEPVYEHFVEGQYPVKGIENVLSGFTRVIGVSGSVTKRFAELLPQYAEKCCTVYNFIDVEQIKSRAREFYPEEFEENTVNILSVGRLTAQKNFTVIPAVCRILLKSGINYKWFIVGDGPQREEIQAEIDREKLGNNLILLGKRMNPYPYFAHCDIYCHPSVTEACCVAINEARIFDRLIVATEFPGIAEQLDNGRGGIIVDCTPEEIAEGIVKAVNMKDSEKAEKSKAAEYPNRKEREAESKLFEILRASKKNG